MGKKVISLINFAIETKHLHITPATKDEASHYLREFDLEITRYLYAQPFVSIDAVKSFIEDFDKARMEERHLVASIYDKSNNFVGSVEFYDLSLQEPKVSIWICKHEWRKGYAYEALKGMINFFKYELHMEHLICETDKRNEAGRALIKKLGGSKISDCEIVSESGNSLIRTKYQLLDIMDDKNG